MKTTVTLSDFREAFRDADRMENFSYDGLEVLFDYFEELENDIGEEMELDVISICCDYNEDSVEDIASNYSIDIDGMDEDEMKEAVMSYLTDNSQIVGETDTTILYAAF